MLPPPANGARPLRSRRWFDDPADPAMTALYLERYMNYGLTRDELQSGRPIIDRSAPARLHYCTHTSLHQCALLENSFVGFKVSFFIKFRRLKKLASVQHPIQLLPAQLGSASSKTSLKCRR